MHLQHWQSLYWERRELWKIDDRSYIETGSIWGRNFFCMPSRIFSSTWGGMMVGRVKLCIWIEREARKYKHTVATTSKYAFFFAPKPCLWRGLGWRYFFAISCYYQIDAALEVVCVGLGLYYPPQKSCVKNCENTYHLKLHYCWESHFTITTLDALWVSRFVESLIGWWVGSKWKGHCNDCL